MRTRTNVVCHVMAFTDVCDSLHSGQTNSITPSSLYFHGQASRCCIVDATWVATGKLMNQILHAVIEELHVANATPNRIVDVLARLVFRKWLQLIANTHSVDDIGILRSLECQVLI